MKTGLSEFLCAAGASCALPLAVGKALYDSKWRDSLSERMVLKSSFADSADGSTVWLHGASVGEIMGYLTLVPALRQGIPGVSFLMSTTSLTGKSMLEEQGLSDKNCLFPLDHPLFVSRFLKSVSPKLVILTETEIWPNMLFSLKRRAIPVMLINGRISDYSFPWYRRFRSILAPALGSLSAVLAQTEIDGERFLELGVSKSRLRVAGCTKYDQDVKVFDKAEIEHYAASLGIDDSKPCFVAGCVRPGEDRSVIEAYLLAREANAALQIIIAPRHPEKFEEAASLLEGFGLDFHRRSQGDAGAPKPVVLLDTLGELSRAYALATIAFVGGTLVDIGGHNVLEPAAYACPVVVGPYTANYRGAVEELKRVGAHLEVSDAKELSECLCDLLGDEQRRNSCGASAHQVWENNRGATSRVMESILEIWEN